VNALERVTAVLERARVAGGWNDEHVAANVLQVLGLDEDGKPAAPSDTAPTSSNLGHG
jgi:hypothetical protein